jgi:hypothetical protein
MSKQIVAMSQDGTKHFYAETDPFGRNPKEAGAKLDAGKSPLRRGLIEYFPRACLAVADVSAFGASKYAWNGWETVPEGVERYGDAMARHIAKRVIEGPHDKDSGLLHAAHEAWNALARLELILRENERGSMVEGNAGSNQGVGDESQRLSKLGSQNATPYSGPGVCDHGAYGGGRGGGGSLRESKAETKRPYY